MWNIIYRIPPVGQSPTFRNHPATYISSPDHAFRDDPPVSIAIKFLAAYRAIAEERLQGVGGVHPAPPGLSIPAAKLPALRRVYAVKPDTLAGNLYGVAVDHAGLAGNVGQGWHRKKQRHREGDQISNHGHIFCRL